MTRLTLGISLVTLLGCGSSTPPAENGPVEGGLSSGGDPVAGNEDDPRVSKSRGVEGGVVVLWPRVLGIPDQEATLVQGHLKRVAEKALPDHPIDVRPDPERACPKSGCLGASIGAVFVMQGTSCVVVAVVSEPEQSPARLVPWVGRVTLRAETIPFREPAE